MCIKCLFELILKGSDAIRFSFKIVIAFFNLSPCKSKSVKTGKLYIVHLVYVVFLW